MYLKYPSAGILVACLVVGASQAYAKLSPNPSPIDSMCSRSQVDRFSAEYGGDEWSPWGSSYICSILGGGGGSGYGGGTYNYGGGGSGIDEGLGGGGAIIRSQPQASSSSGGGTGSAPITSQSASVNYPSYSGYSAYTYSSYFTTIEELFRAQDEAAEQARRAEEGLDRLWQDDGAQVPSYVNEPPSYYEPYTPPTQVPAPIVKPQQRVVLEPFQLKAEIDRSMFQEVIEVASEEVERGAVTREEQLREQLDAFSDVRKRTVATRINEQLGDINKKWGKLFTTSINHTNGVVEAIISRTRKLQDEGKDTRDLEKKIIETQRALAEARSVLQAQSGVAYTLVIRSEETVQADATAARDALRRDLEKVRSAVRAAYTAAEQSAQALRTVSES